MHSIIEVKDKKGWKLFHRVPHIVFKDDPKWVCPLESDVETVFNPEKNKALQQGEAACFVLLNGSGKPAGRIAAFINHEHNKALPYPVGGIGFFDCIDNKEYAFALFEKAENWLRDKGAKAVDGPINFGDREKFWGLLVKGFFPPLYQENYNPEYYQHFFEAGGFIPFEQVLTFRGETSNIPMDRFNKLMDMLGRRYNIRNEHLQLNKLEKFAEDFCEVYNAAFKQYEHFKPVFPAEVIKTIEEAKSIIDPKIIVMTYFNERPAGFCLTIPDINQLIKPAKGKLNWRTLPLVLWRKWTVKSLNAKGIAFGVHPDFRTKGIAGIVLGYMSRDENRNKYPVMYFTTVRGHNTEAVSVYLKMGVEIDRLHLAYRKPLAEGVEITPHEFIELPSHLQ
ncbi:MAG: GNAT family N-acetyltransferase [Phaeodactylibacter sp.]|nr:GNAT family N-acetyltransferase [Phaeodactylibacter sp.]